MIKINLLPYREIKRQEKRQHFYAVLAIVVILALLAALAVYLFLEGEISSQEARNTRLVNINRELDKEIAEIKELEARKQDLISRKNVIESLQKDRGNAVHLLTTLVRQVPEGIYLRTIKQVDKKITITGYAQNNARITMLIKNLGGSDKKPDESDKSFLERTELVESKAVLLDKRRLYEFTLNTYIKTPKKPAAEAGDAQ